MPSPLRSKSGVLEGDGVGPLGGFVASGSSRSVVGMGLLFR
jgi:hypothetical protein